jgi:squalene synthase HpnC
MFSRDFQLYGPQATPRRTISLPEAERYCRRLAKTHYENFTVASWLLPRRLRQHFFNVYAYCRWADDLADEAIKLKGDSPIFADAKIGTVPPNTKIGTVPLKLLDWWESQLRDCYREQSVHPVFIALAQTIKYFDIPDEPFVDLLKAFRQDQRIKRYETIDQLLDYCRFSANPVGRLVLYLGESHSDERVRLADSICTGLQLANFCQDVAEDWDRGRIYLPQADCRQFGYSEEMFSRRECNEEFCRLMAAQVDRAEKFLRDGLPLINTMQPGLKLDTALFIHGGLAILKAIRRQNYDVWTSRPKVSKMEKLRLLFECWRRLKISHQV